MYKEKKIWPNTQTYVEKIKPELETYIKIWIAARLGGGSFYYWHNNTEIDNCFYWLDDQVLRILQHAESLMIPAFLQYEDKLSYYDLYRELNALYKREKAAELAAIKSGQPLELKVARKEIISL